MFNWLFKKEKEPEVIKFKYRVEYEEKEIPVKTLEITIETLDGTKYIEERHGYIDTYTNSYDLVTGKKCNPYLQDYKNVVSIITDVYENGPYQTTNNNNGFIVYKDLDIPVHQVKLITYSTPEYKGRTEKVNLGKLVKIEE